MKQPNKGTLSLFWNKNKKDIKIGAKCLLVGFGIGFIKGVIMETKLNVEILERVPKAIDDVYLSFDNFEDLKKCLATLDPDELRDIGEMIKEKTKNA